MDQHCADYIAGGTAAVRALQQWINDERLRAIVTADNEAVFVSPRIQAITNVDSTPLITSALVRDRRSERDLAKAGADHEAAVGRQAKVLGAVNAHIEHFRIRSRRNRKELFHVVARSAKLDRNAG